MEYRLTENEKKKLHGYLAKWEPYSEEELELIPLDGDIDAGRAAATLAKRALEADEEDNGTS